MAKAEELGINGRYLEFCRRLDKDFFRPQIEDQTPGAELVVELSREADFLSPVHFSSHRKLGSIIISCKTLIRKVMRPLLKVCMVKQENFNQMTVTLASTVSDLEEKVDRLESLVMKLSSHHNVGRK